MPQPFILLDDARLEGAHAARCYRDPHAIVVAHRPDEVAPALARLETLSAAGAHLAGHIAYEAGLALEPRLAHLAAARTGAGGPLLWFGAFAGYEAIAARDMPGWLAERADRGRATIGPLAPMLSPGDYRARFEALVAAIRAGDIYQANLTFPMTGSWRGDPLALYAALRPVAGAGHGGIVHDGSSWLLSFSPELFFALSDGVVTARPMKGTRPRGADPAADAALAADLAASAKDRAEHLMIVDLMRNDLSRVSLPGSVRVENGFAIEHYPTVHQMVSTIRARLRPAPGGGAPEPGPIDVVRALFPCGSITGAPKIRAMELIAANEPDPRGAYCGAIGRIDPAGENGGDGAGTAAFNVAIRTVRLVAGNDGALQGRAVLGVGSAVVADSDALAEWRECLVKARFVEQPASVSGFDLIETMAFVPGAQPDCAIALLALHLDRLEASAATLGFAFDRAALGAAIKALCADCRAPGRLRLMLSRGGAWTLDLGPPPAPLAAPARCIALPLPVDPGDWRLRHKASDRGFYDAARAVARRAGADEALLVRDDGLVAEGSFTSVFVARDGVLLTPPAALGLLPGVLRASLLATGRARQAALTLDDLADGFLIGNALRGLLPAVLAP